MTTATRPPAPGIKILGLEERFVTRTCSRRDALGVRWLTVRSLD